MAKTSQFFSINSVQIRPDPKFMKQFTIRIQSKFDKIRHSPDPVQSKSRPMLISFKPLLGRTRSRGRCWAAIRLSHRSEPSDHVVHGEVDGLDIGGQHGRWFVLLRYIHRAQRRPYPICTSRSGNVRQRCGGGWAGPRLFLGGSHGGWDADVGVENTESCGTVCPLHIPLVIHPPTAPHICCCCQMNWWDVVRRVQMGVSIWGAVGLHSMDGWVLSGADVQAPQHGVLETVWLRCDEAQQVIWLPGRLSAGVARKHPVTIRKASLMAGSMRRVWALWHQRGAQYSAVEWTRTRWLFAQLLLQHPNRSQQAASGALHVMSTSCEVTQGVGDAWATCPTLLRGIWAQSRRAGFRCCIWL